MVKEKPLMYSTHYISVLDPQKWGGLSALWQRLTFPGRQTRGSAQGRDKEEEMLTGPKLMAKCLVLQAQCTGGGDEWARGRDSGMPSWSEVPVGLLLWTRVGGCSQGGVRT